MKKRLWRRPVGLSSVVLVAAAGCDLRHPAATAVPPPHISTSYLDIEEPQSLGSPHYIPENSSLGEPDWVQATNIGTLPDSAWIVIEVRGTVLHTKHWWCDELYKATGGCYYPLDGVRLGPLERHGGSGVIVTLLPPGIVPNPYFSVGLDAYAPDGNDHGDLARNVVRNTTGPKVLWYRRLDATPKPVRNRDGARGPMYNMFSDQKVSARVVPTPLRVDAPATVRPRDVATFSVSPTSDFKFKMPDRDTRRHFVRWRYFPGDTAARPNPFGPAQDVPCDSIACRWAPTKSGRMWAFTYVDGFGVEAKSQIVRIGQPEFILECADDFGRANTVTRGERISCALRTDPPGGQLEIEQWWFIGTDSRGQEYRYDQEDVPTGSWSGEMALSGVVHVRARVNGAAPVEKSAAITVTNRRWDNQTIKYHVQRVGLDDFPERRRPPLPPRDVRDLGRTYMEATHLSRSDPGVLKFIQDDGPNSLLAYLGRIPLEAAALVLVSPAMAKGSNFYRAQRVDPPAFSQTPPCLQRDFDRYVSLILHHEGYPPNPESHTGVFISELTPRARIVEDVVGPNDALHELQIIWEKRLEDATAQALVHAGDPVDDRFRIPFGSVLSG